MSFGAASIPTKAPKTANLDASDTSSNQEATPVPIWAGYDERPLQWIVPTIYDWETIETKSKAGKGAPATVVSSVSYGTVAGVAGFGLLSRITKIKADGETVWTGNIVRPDDPDHPDYWRVKIVTTVGLVYVYWGRHNQPVDDVLLGPLGDADPALKHPAYRYQVLVILKRFRLSEGGSLPNFKLGAWRAPQPAFESFPAQNSSQGESMVAFIAELLTHPITGAGFPAEMFTAANVEGVSAAVIARCGCHSPSLVRAQQLRSIVKELMFYYDGWIRLENGKFVFGFYPHDGTVPGGLTEWTVHDFVSKPEGDSSTPTATVNEVVVVYRDAADEMKSKPTSESASDNVDARRTSDPRRLEMLAFIDSAQASAFAAEAADTGAEGMWERNGQQVRRPRASWAGGVPLQAGDNVALDLLSAQVDQIVRIVRRTDYYAAAPEFDLVAERGLYPSPYQPPQDTRIDAGKIIPQEIVHARVFELTPELADTPIGLPIAFLALRPRSTFENVSLQAANVLGFTAWYSPDGVSYDQVGSQSGWTALGTLREDLPANGDDVTVKLTMHADNLDLGRMLAQSDSAQIDDTLLLIVGDEVFSVGATTVAGADRDYVCKRMRQGSRFAAHLTGAEAWLVYRAELVPYIHRDFIEDEDRYFKLQPYTQSAPLALADVDELVYHFRDRADELPVIVIDALPAGLRERVSYRTSGTISDVNGDLTDYEVTAARMVAGDVDEEFTLRSGVVPPAARALFEFKASFAFPSAGTWRIIVRAWDRRGEFTEEQTADLTVAVGLGVGEDDGVVPNAISSLTRIPGLRTIFLEWAWPTNTPMLEVDIYASSAAVMPALPSYVVQHPRAFEADDGLGNAETRYYWLRPRGRNLREGTVTGPFSATTRAGVNLSDVVPGMTLVEVVTSLPSSGNFDGRTVVLVSSTIRKLYRYNAGTAAWTTEIDGYDLVANSILAGAIAAGAVTAYAVGTNLLITDEANIDNAVINTQHVVNAAIKTAKIDDLQVTTLKIGDNAVTLPVTGYSASSMNTTGPTAGSIVLQSVNIDADGASDIDLLMGTQWNPSDNFTFGFYVTREDTINSPGTESTVFDTSLKSPEIGPNYQAFPFSDPAPPASNYTYRFRISWVSAFYSHTPFSRRYLKATQTKR